MVQIFKFASYVQLFFDALHKVKSKPIFTISTPRHKKVILDLEEIVRNLDKDSVINKISYIVREIEEIVKSVKPGKHIMSRIWPRFHSHRQGNMVQSWDQLADVIGVELDCIVVQDVSMEILVSMISKPLNVSASGKPAVARVFSTLEEQAVMYAGGFVVKMLQWLDTIEREVASQYYETLYGMLEGGKWDSERTENFEAFVHSWIADIDRGGLQILNETALDFIHTYLVEYSSIIHAYKCMWLSWYAIYVPSVKYSFLGAAAGSPYIVFISTSGM